MANSPKDISSTALKIFNPDAIYVTPFKENQRGTDTYKLSEVIKDTTSIVQDDPEETKIENEFSSAPILSNINLGSYQFSADVADMQATVLEKLCGYVKGTQDTDRIFAPAKYTPVFAEIVLTFKVSDSKTVAAVLPKVQLNSKATFESLSSNLGVIRLAGAGQNIAVTDGETQKETPFYIDTQWSASEL